MRGEVLEKTIAGQQNKNFVDLNGGGKQDFDPKTPFRPIRSFLDLYELSD